VITIIETSRDLFDAASSADGLHEAFRAVSQNIPLVLNILRDCKNVQARIDRDYIQSTDDDLKRDIEDSTKAVEPLILACGENARRLQDIFQKVVPEDDAGWAERYKKAAYAVMPGKKRKVEDLMREILEKPQLLHTSRFFKSENERKNEKKSKEQDRNQSAIRASLISARRRRPVQPPWIWRDVHQSWPGNAAELQSKRWHQQHAVQRTDPELWTACA